MTRNDLIEHIKKGIEEAYPENVELDADDIDIINDTVVEKVCKDAAEATDEDDEEATQEENASVK